MRLTTIGTLILALSPLTAWAQTTASVSAEERSRPRMDVTASVAWFRTTHDDLFGDGSYSYGPTPKFSSPFTGLGVGVYWTTHIKTEVDFGWTKLDGLYSSRNANIPGAQYAFVYSEHDYRTFRTSIAQSYQLGRNAWVHPFVGAGVDIDRERHEIRQPAQTVWYYTDWASPPQTVPVPASNRTETTVGATPFFKTGFKAYMTKDAFFITDFKVGTAIVWKFGVGFDF